MRTVLRNTPLVSVVLLLAGCASAPRTPVDQPMDQEPLEEVAAAPQCGEETSQPCFTPYTVAPVLINTAAVKKSLTNLYPKEMRGRGIAGTAVIWVFVDEQGRVQSTRLRKSSGFPEFDRAAQQVARRMIFEPARNRDLRVKLWVEVPIQFPPYP